MSLKLQSVMFLLFFMSYLYSEQGNALFDPIHAYLKKYRHNIEIKDLTINNGLISLELDGRRTNFNSLVLLGFYSVGRQLQKKRFPYNKIQIIIHYEMKNTQQIVVTASIESVLGLSQGRINPDQFFDEIHY